jgi:hypothetical protein
MGSETKFPISGLRIYGLGFMVDSLVFRIYAFGFGVQGWG